jgi:DNA-binding NarL/FixJ family response regulator
METEILLADDHTILREGLRALLRNHRDMRVVAEAGDGREAVRLARELSPHVVVMDLAMPGLGGVEATRQILEAKPETKILVLSLYSADRPLIAACFHAGASGYLPKEASFDELAVAIRTVMQERVYISPSAEKIVLEALRHPNADGSAFWRLTPREREVLQELAEGHAMKQVAVRLDLSVKTIETHRRQIMDKLDLHSVAELTKYAIRQGLTKVGDVSQEADRSGTTSEG